MPKQKLVIAEKPSVGMALAKVLGCYGKRPGYMIGSGYIVTWCVGHLAGLADASAYDPSYAKWRWADLPIIPENWQFTLDKKKIDQFAVVKKQMHREEVTEVINACDAGREGELIFRTVYQLVECDKPMKRLWISSMEDKAIREGFEHLRPGSDYWCIPPKEDAEFVACMEDVLDVYERPYIVRFIDAKYHQDNTLEMIKTVRVRIYRRRNTLPFSALFLPPKSVQCHRRQ